MHDERAMHAKITDTYMGQPCALDRVGGKILEFLKSYLLSRHSLLPLPKNRGPSQRH